MRAALAVQAVLVVSMALFSVACGKKGNVALVNAEAVTSAGTTAVSVSTFKVCATSIRIYDEKGAVIKNGSAEEYSLDRAVAVDLTKSPVESIGTFSLPLGKKVTKFVLHLKADGEKCPGSGGNSFALIFGTFSTGSVEMDLSFSLSAATELVEGDTIKLSFKPLATALADANTAGELTSASAAKSKAEAAVGTASK